jgi:hypothetical protein
MHGPVQARRAASVQSTERVPFISIVIPAFNVALYLEACLTSVLREVDAARALGKARFEIIVVDDCSADGTVALARGLLGARKDARVITHTTNRGPGGARNTGIDAGRGDYFLFLDSDNTLLQGALLRIVDALREHADADVIILGMDLIDEHGQSKGRFYGDRVRANPVALLQRDPFLLIEGNSFDNFSVIRASAVRLARYDESTRGLTDWDLWLRLRYEHECSFAMLETSVGTYRIRPGQLTQAETPQTKPHARAALQIHAKALAMALRRELPTAAVQRILRSVQSAGASYLRHEAPVSPVAQPGPAEAPARGPAQEVQATPPAAASLATVQLTIGAKTFPFAFRPDSDGDKGVIARTFQNDDYRLARWAQGRRFLEYYAANVASKPGLIIDAGAKIGAAAVYFLELFGNSFVCAIEPEAGNFGILELNTRAYKNKTTLHTSVAAVDGERCLSVPSILKAAAAGIPMIFKCDMEGGESDVFAGDPGWMRLFPVIIVALHDGMLPFSGTSRSFIRAVAQHDFDFIHRDENIFLFNRQLLA